MIAPSPMRKETRDETSPDHDGESSSSFRPCSRPAR